MKRREISSLKKIKKPSLNFYKDTSLMLAMFFLPFGYDALFKMVMELTGSYWGADAVFYSISGFFWLLYIFFSKYTSKKKLLND